MTQAEDAETERLLLAAVLDETEEIDASLRRSSLVFRGVFIDGWYPDAALVVRCFSLERDAVGELRFPIRSLWTGDRLSPRTAAGIVVTNIFEGIGWTWSSVG